MSWLEGVVGRAAGLGLIPADQWLVEALGLAASSSNGCLA